MPDVELLTEQRHLAEAREALGRMRRRTRSLDSSAAGDWVSQILLESAMARRRKALEDDPTVPLFFGRLDYAAGHPEAGTTFYVGRRHVADDHGDPMVVDWRAPISLPFYRAGTTEPLGVELRRRFGFQQGRLTAYEDEVLSGPRRSESGQYSQIVADEIERPRVGPMRDIVATIQPEQDVIVRADLATSICIQGAPGTGKTVVGLHRAAYLLYAHRDQLARQRVLVVGPNESFLSYIGDVLPALGEIDATQTTVERLAEESLKARHPKAALRGTDSPEVARIKGDARLAEVLHRAVWSGLSLPSGPLEVPWGSRRHRVHPWQVEEIVEGLRSRGVRYGAARAMLAQRLAHEVLVRMEEDRDSPDDRVQDRVARSREVRRYVDAIWPAVDPARLVHRLLSDAEALASAGAGLLTEDEARALQWSRPARTPASAPWSVADAVLVDEAADLVDRTASWGHVVLDEAQDLSAMMLRLVGRRATTGSVTVLGDVAQATTAWATTTWSDALAHLGKPEAHVEELTKGFRVPGEVLEYAARLLPVIAPALAPPRSVRRTRGELRVDRVPDPASEAAAIVRDRPGVGSTGVIVPDRLLAGVVTAFAAAGLGFAVVGSPSTVTDDGTDGPSPESDPDPVWPEAPLDLVPASLAKGLEFDHVVLLEPEDIVAGEPERTLGLRRLYVCLTRAVTSLQVLHTRELPDELGR